MMIKFSITHPRGETQGRTLPMVILWLMFTSPLWSQDVSPLNSEAMSTELHRLSGICDKLKLVQEKELTDSWLVSAAADAQTLYLPVEPDPRSSGNRKSPAEKADAHSNWQKAFHAARRRHAEFWYQEARRLAESGDEWQAYLAIWHAAREDATHSETKRVLGTLLASLNAKAKPRTVNTVHTEYGWAAGSYWRVETPNFKITSHADTKTTLAIAKELEEFYVLWTQAFYPLWAPPNVVELRLAGRNTNWNQRRQIDVVICKDRQDYLKTLGVSESNIGVSVGYYSPEAQKSFFYPDPSFSATLYHELTHQLLAEASQLRNGSKAGSESGFWLVEAIALYMESLTKYEHHWQLGGWLAPRMQAARYRAIHDGYWKPPEQLQTLSIETWKNDDQLAQLYTYSTGLAHYFLDRRLPAVADETQPDADDQNALQGLEHLDAYDSDKSKETFFRAIVATYQGQTADADLWSLMGNQPQRSYVHFLLVRDRHIAGLRDSPQAEQVKELVLTRSQLAKASWETLAKCRQLQWLDVSYSNATAADLGWMVELKSLERLSLEGLRIDMELLRKLQGLPKLKELDLSGCQIEDDQLQSLGTFAALETLWLSGNSIGRGSRAWIVSQPKLSSVSLDGTQFSAADAEEINKQLSKRH